MFTDSVVQLEADTRTWSKCSGLLSVFVEEPVTRSCPAELFRHDAEEGGPCQSAGHVGLQRAAHCQVHVVGVFVQSRQ